MNWSVDKLNTHYENFSLKKDYEFCKGKVSYFFEEQDLNLQILTKRVQFAVLPINIFQTKRIFRLPQKNKQQHTRIVIQRRQNVSRTLLLQTGGVAVNDPC